MINGDRLKITLDVDSLKKLGDDLRFRSIGKSLYKIIDNYIELIGEIYDFNFVEQEFDPA